MMMNTPATYRSRTGARGRTIRILAIACCSILLSPLYGQFVYVVNDESFNISAYSIRGATGALTPVKGSPFTATEAAAVGVDPLGSFVYVAGGSFVTGYAIDATTGALTEIDGSPFGADAYPQSVATDPSGRFVYVANEGAKNISAYTINATSGALTTIAGSPFAAGNYPYSVVVHPSGKFVYAANENAGQSAGNISGYSIGPGGELTPLAGSPFTAGPYPRSLAADPTGKFLYVANSNYGSFGSVSAYSIDAASGALTEITGSPFPAGNTPYGITVDPSGMFVYVPNGFSDNVSAYSINQLTGALTEMSGSPFAAGGGPTGAAVAPSGKFLYVTNSSSSNVSAYSISSTGGLAPLSSSPYRAGHGPVSIAIAPQSARRR